MATAISSSVKRTRRIAENRAAAGIMDSMTRVAAEIS